MNLSAEEISGYIYDNNLIDDDRINKFKVKKINNELLVNFATEEGPSPRNARFYEAPCDKPSTI